jgi:hypothetical protein
VFIRFRTVIPPRAQRGCGKMIQLSAMCGSHESVSIPDVNGAFRAATRLVCRSLISENSAQGESRMKILLRTFSFGIVVLASLLSQMRVHADLIYVSNSGNNTIARFDADGQGTVFASGLRNPQGLAFDDDGNLYVANSGNNTIVRFNPAGQSTVFANSGLSSPRGLAFDDGGNLYVANSGNNTIARFDVGGHGTVFANTGLANPFSLVFDSLGNLYVSNYGNNTIERFDATGSGTVFLAFPPWGIQGPQGLAIDGSDNLYVVSRVTAQILKFDASGNGSWFGGSAYFGSGLAFDSSGNLFATEPLYPTDVLKFGPGGGSGSVFATANLSSPMFIAIQVPEPATWTLVVLGGLTFAVGRRVYRRSS